MKTGQHDESAVPFGGKLGDEFRRIWRAINGNQIVPSAGQRVSRTTRGTVLSNSTLGTGFDDTLPPVGMFEIETAANGYDNWTNPANAPLTIAGRRVTGATASAGKIYGETQTIAIAPFSNWGLENQPSLMPDPFSLGWGFPAIGAVFGTYLSAFQLLENGGTWVISPAYNVGDVVFAAHMTGLQSALGGPAEWLDLNPQGRRWKNVA